MVDFDKQLSPEDKGELMWNLWDETEKLLNRKVDLVSKTSLTNPFFIEELNETKQRIYGKTG